MSWLENRPLLMPDEPLLSFASRTARCYETDLTSLCHEVGLNRRELALGVGDSALRLARLTKLDPTMLADRAFAWEGGVWRFKGQALHRLGVRRLTLAVCPLCLKDDVAGSRLRPDRAAYVRAHWLVSAVRTCVEHRLALVEILEPTPPAGMAIHDLAKRLAPSLDGLDQLVSRGFARQATRLERYIIDRLHGIPVEGGLADTMPLYAGTRTCEMLGAAALFGPHARLRALDEHDWRAAGAVGFDVVSLGPGAVASCLAQLMDSHGVANRNIGPYKVFGSLYRWLETADSGPDYGPFRAVLREVIFDTIPLAAGTEVLGVTLDRRRVHSLHSAATEMRQGLKGLRRELRSAGIIVSVDGGGAGRLVPIPVTEAARAVENVAASLPRAKAAAHIGATVADFKRLAKAGLVTSIATKPGVARSHVRFPVQILDNFLARLASGVTDVCPADADMRDIPTAAKLTARGLVNITQAVMDGKLRYVVHRPGAGGFRSLLVDIDEVVRIPITGEAGLGVDAVARKLKINRVTALALVRSGSLIARRVTSPMSQRIVTVVDSRSFEKFEKKFVSLSALSEQTGIAWSVIKELLTAEDITPALPFDHAHNVIYCRREISKTEFPSKSPQHKV